MKFFNQNQSGFTFVELLVVMAIIFLLSGALLLSAGSESQKLALRNEAFILAQNLREVEEMAMAAQAVDCDLGSANIFGVNFNKPGSDWEKSYTIFADCNSTPNFYFDVNDEIIRQVSFDESVKICSITQPVVDNDLDILFQPPEPVVHIDGITLDQEAIITLCLESDISQTRQVRINTVGRIEMKK